MDLGEWKEGDFWAESPWDPEAERSRGPAGLHVPAVPGPAFNLDVLFLGCFKIILLAAAAVLNSSCLCGLCCD